MDLHNMIRKQTFIYIWLCWKKFQVSILLETKYLKRYHNRWNVTAEMPWHKWQDPKVSLPPPAASICLLGNVSLSKIESLQSFNAQLVIRKQWKITGMFHPLLLWFHSWNDDQFPNFEDSQPRKDEHTSQMDKMSELKGLSTSR